MAISGLGPLFVRPERLLAPFCPMGLNTECCIPSNAVKRLGSSAALARIKAATGSPVPGAPGGAPRPPGYWGGRPPDRIRDIVPRSVAATGLPNGQSSASGAAAAAGFTGGAWKVG